jgi:uncharacterized protein
VPSHDFHNISTDLMANIDEGKFMKNEVGLLKKAMEYVTDLLEKRLPAIMTFHNLHHTREVFEAVQQICSEEPLTPDECFIVQMAAVFHDSGYLFTYAGHEECSMGIAGTYLIREGLPAILVEEVVSCIAATKMPQNPVNLKQKALCDADMNHFARKDYPQYAARLKSEWENHYHKKFDILDWDTSNLEVLSRHHYFTKYAQTVWQPLKQVNIDLLQKEILAGKSSKETST